MIGKGFTGSLRDDLFRVRIDDVIPGLDSQVAYADKEGNFRILLQVSSEAEPGQYPVTAEDDRDNVMALANFRVT
ncbi:hypothetical protein ABZW18_25920 [Streptomyces sp. NPDC004647]|uniref:hypothetical protein n=1 Tax=Streptomyces sp. NPDC004647 TaxID=3154671 RepID=UPI00339FBFD1